MAELTLDTGILAATADTEGLITLTLTQFGAVVNQVNYASDVTAIPTEFDLSPSSDGCTFEPDAFTPLQLVADGSGGFWLLIGRTYRVTGDLLNYPSGYELVLRHFDGNLNPIGDPAVLDYENDFFRYAPTGGDFYEALPAVVPLAAENGDLLVFVGLDLAYGGGDEMPLEVSRIGAATGNVLYKTELDFSLNPVSAELDTSGADPVVRLEGRYAYNIGPDLGRFFELDLAIDPATGALEAITRHVNTSLPEMTLGFLFNDRIPGTEGDDLIHGLSGDDGIPAYGGNDTIYGGEGNDTIAAGAGDDSINGGEGFDRVAGGDGNDTIRVGSNDTVFAGPGRDQITASGSGNLVRSGYGSDFVEVGDGGGNRVYAGPGNDTVRSGNGDDQLAGGSGDDNMIAREGNDSIFGGAGNDTVQGRAGDDLVQGGFGNDLVVGDQGNDTLDAGPGNDTLTGGADADVFVFNAAQPRQTNLITDMQLFEDRISIAGVDGADDAARFDALDITDVTLDGGGAAAAVVIDNVTILVAGVAAADLGAEDFLFT